MINKISKFSKKQKKYTDDIEKENAIYEYKNFLNDKLEKEGNKLVLLLLMG